MDVIPPCAACSMPAGRDFALGAGQDENLAAVAKNSGAAFEVSICDSRGKARCDTTA
jgi:hypothetical protein